MQTLETRINQFLSEWEYYFYQDRNQKCLPSLNKFHQQIDHLLELNKQTKKQKALLYYLKGKILDFVPAYDKMAEDLLNKSIKLNPVNGDCWNTLAHVLYKKKDFEGAHKAIQMALENKGKNKISLRYQSVLLRNQGTTPAQKAKNVEQSIKLIKQALMLDMNDPVTWFFLGNAYMNNFFTNYKKVQQLQNAIKAYNQAQKYFKYKYPDLFYNRATAENHLENYEQAIKDLKQADLIDPNLESGSTTSSFIEKLDYIKKTFERVNQYKPQKILELVKDIPNSIKDQQNVKIVPLKTLKQRYNPKMMLSVKVLKKVSGNGQIPESFLVIDSSGEFLCVSIYNINSTILNEKIKQDTLIQIKDPELKRVKYGDFSYLSVQVIEILNMWINGSKLSRNQFQANFVVNKSVEN